MAESKKKKIHLFFHFLKFTENWKEKKRKDKIKEVNQDQDPNNSDEVETILLLPFRFVFCGDEGDEWTRKWAKKKKEIVSKKNLKTWKKCLSWELTFKDYDYHHQEGNYEKNVSNIFERNCSRRSLQGEIYHKFLMVLQFDFRFWCSFDFCWAKKILWLGKNSEKKNMSELQKFLER